MYKIQESLNQMMDAFNHRLDVIEGQLPKSSTVSPGSLEAEFTSFKAFVLTSFRALQGQIGLLAQQMDQIEMRGRRKALLLHGLQESPKEDVTSVVVRTIAEHLQFTGFTSDDIKHCHRMGREANKVHPRPILFKLHDVGLRDKIWMTKTKLKDSGITMSEFLTKTRHNLFMTARQRFGVSKCWTRAGHVYVLGPDAIRHRLNRLEDLDAISPKESAKTTKQLKEAAAPAPSKTKRTAGAKK